MVDYEGLILQKQELMEIYEDEPETSFLESESWLHEIYEVKDAEGVK